MAIDSITRERHHARHAPQPGQTPDGQRAPMPRRFARLLRILAWTTGLAALALALGYVGFARSLTVAEPAAAPRADAIVAVTGGSNRIGDAIELLQARHGRRLLISGVNEKTGREELARLNPAGREMIACCVDLDHRARNTIGNAIETRRWARQNGFASLVIVTSNYHMPRTMLEFQHAMPGVRLLGYPVANEAKAGGRWWQEPAAARLIGAEYVKYLAAWVRSQVEGDPETSRLSIIIGGRKPVSPRGSDAIRPPEPVKEPQKETRTGPLSAHRSTET